MDAEFPQHIGRLIAGMFNDELDDQEQKELQDWITASPENAELINSFKIAEELRRELSWFNHPKLADIEERINNHIAVEPTGRKSQGQPFIVHRVHFLRTAWFRVAVVILLFSSIGGYLWLRNPKPGLETVAKQSVPVQNDVMPGGHKAILTLADGSIITLDSAAGAGGTIAQQSGANIQQSANGEIIYTFDKTSTNKLRQYNTMSTPRGGTYQLVLPDGSKVWLNVESSVTFPTAFTGNTREIKMTGEAYFEIKPNPTKPFIVKTISDEIKVLGTSFNINAYNDEPVKTSLLEGRVKINTSILKPGQAYTTGKITPTNINQDLAWKNGLFDFNQKGIQEMAHQIARWYNVDIVFDDAVENVEMYGKADRNISLQGLLKGLEGEVAHFALKGRILHIKAL